MSYDYETIIKENVKLSRPTSIFQCRSKSGQLLQTNALNWEFSSECQSFLNYYNNNEDENQSQWVSSIN